MEFSYKISEEEYLKVFKPKLKMRGLVIAVLFWVVVLALLMLVITEFQRFAQQAQVTQQSAVHRVGSGGNLSGTLSETGFLVLMVGLWVSHSFVMPKLRRRGYRKDPAMQGEFSVNLQPDSITVENSVGTYYRSGWNVYFGWYETRGVIVLSSHVATPNSILINLAGLSDLQQSELRGILSTAIPKKLKATTP